MADEGSFNTLILSDLHLTYVFDDEDRATDEELVLFLDHYRQNRPQGRPWRLVLAGDTFDFVYPDMALFLARHPGPAQPGASRDGLLVHWDVDAMAWRLRVTMREHEKVFRALGAFCASGNSIWFIKGNHDVELQWGVLQRAFSEEMAAIVGIPLQPGRLVFTSWFYLEPGRLYVEHGSQYDEFNAMPNFLDPALTTDPKRAFAPLGSRLTQYLTNAFTDYKPRPVPGAFMAYLKRTGQSWSKKYITRSLTVLHHSLLNAGLFSEEGWKSGSGREDEALRHMEQVWGVPVDTLLQLQAFAAVPATAQSGWIYNRFLLDRLFVLVFGLAMMGMAVALGALSPTEPALLAVSIAPVAAIIGLWWRFKLKRGRRAWRWAALPFMVGACVLASSLSDRSTLSGSVIVSYTVFVVTFALLGLPFTEASDLRAHLVRTAWRVSRLLQVPNVVFGHHHTPLHHTLEPGVLYLNSGAWASSGLDHSHAHVTVVDDVSGQPQALLHRGRDFLVAASSCERPDRMD